MEQPFRIGVLSLQGAFERHERMVTQLGVSCLQVRYPSDLSHCSGLILPGGESTVMRKHIVERGFEEPLHAFARHFPLFGTCAGLILMSKGNLLDLLSITVERNAYGRQVASFSTSLPFFSQQLKALFIRAPRITAIHTPEVNVLASCGEEPVLVQQGSHLGASFHPELTNDGTIHQYFIQLCKEKQLLPQQLRTTPTKSFQTI